MSGSPVHRREQEDGVGCVYRVSTPEWDRTSVRCAGVGGTDTGRCRKCLGSRRNHRPVAQIAAQNFVSNDPGKDTGAAAAPVSLTFPHPARTYADGSAWAPRAGTLLHRQQRVPLRPAPSAQSDQLRFTARPKKNPGGRLPQFFLGTFSSLPSYRAQMDRPGLRERCYTPAPTAPPGRPTAQRIRNHINRTLAVCASARYYPHTCTTWDNCDDARRKSSPADR